MIHTCEGCGLVHDTMAAPQPDREVEIARIQAESAYKIAQINARQDRDWNETRVEVAAIEGEAQVESATAEAEVIGAVLAAGVPEQPEPEQEPALPPVVIQDNVNDVPAPPPAEHQEPPAVKPKKGLGFW